MILPTSTRMAFAHQSPLVLGQTGHVKAQAVSEYRDFLGPHLLLSDNLIL